MSDSPDGHGPAGPDGVTQAGHWLEMAGFAQHHPALLAFHVRHLGASLFGLTGVRFSQLQVCRVPRDQRDAQLLADAFMVSDAGRRALLNCVPDPLRAARDACHTDA